MSDHNHGDSYLERGEGGCLLILILFGLIAFAAVYSAKCEGNSPAELRKDISALQTQVAEQQR